VGDGGVTSLKLQRTVKAGWSVLIPYNKSGVRGTKDVRNVIIVIYS
jgi:hypothetical protein